MKVGFISLGCLSTTLSCTRYFNYLKYNGYYNSELENADCLVIVCCVNKYENEVELGNIVEQFKAKPVVLTGCIIPEIIKKFHHPNCRIIREDAEFENYFPPIKLKMKDINLSDVTNICNNGRIPLYIRNIFKSYDTFIDIVRNINKEAAFKICNSFVGYEFRNKQQNYYPILISEGCNFMCNYCIVCKIKGRCVSRSVEEIIGDIKIGYDNGYRIFLLLADDMLSYGKDIYGELRFPFLLEKIQKEFKDIKLMIRYMEPMNLPKLWAQIKQFMTDDLICYLNIPIQSASENVLNAINRHTNLYEIESIITQIREKYTGPIITHIVYGFPFETEEDIVKTQKYLSLFDNASIHEFSPRENTMFEQLSVHSNAQEHFQILDKAKKVIQAKFLKRTMSMVTKKVPEKAQKEREYRYPITYITEQFKKILSSLEWIEDGEQRDIVFMNPQVKGFVVRIRQNNDNLFLQIKIEKEKFEWHEISTRIDKDSVDDVVAVLKEFMVPMGVVSKNRKHAIFSSKINIYLDDVEHLGSFFEVEGIDKAVDDLLYQFSIDIDKAYPPYGKMLDKLELNIDDEITRAISKMNSTKSTDDY